MNLADLLAALPHYQLHVDLHRPAQSDNSPSALPNISKITFDSRQVEPGTLFVAYRGVSVDGHQFIPQAIKRGAAAVVCEALEEPGNSAGDGNENENLFRPHPVAGATPLSQSGRGVGGEGLLPKEWVNAGHPPVVVVPNGREALAYIAAAWHNYPAKKLTMVGITGTDGKTTTTNFLFHILRAAKKRVGMINTVNALIGDTFLETGLHTTTPDAPDVQKYLAQMVAAGTEICLLETTSHGLAQHRVTACDFDIAIVTNITHEHLDIHGSLEGYRAAKASLFESLATAASKGLPKTAILNCDDWSFEYLKKKLKKTGTAWLGYSLKNHPQATLAAQNIECRPDKTGFTVVGPGYTFEAETTLLGDYNISNCLAATAAAVEVLGISPAVARQGIAALPGVPGRMERIDEGQPFTAVVDFAHTPNSLRRALATARQLTQGRVIAVFGCAGLRDVEKRVTMGQAAAELADIIIITAEDPRTENLDSIIDQTAQAMLAKGAIEGQTFERIPDRGRAIYRAVQLAQPGDMVLALGKGHEQSMCFGQVEYPWDDRHALRTALKGRPLLTLPPAQKIV